MRSVWFLVRARLRRRLRATAATVLVLGVGGGMVLALLGAAHRTDTAYDRFLDRSRAADLVVEGVSSSPSEADLLDLYARLARDPSVESSGVAQLVKLQGRTDTGRRFTDLDVLSIAAIDGHVGHDIQGFHILQGRSYNPVRTDEVVVSSLLAERLDLHVGSVITGRLTTQQDEIDAQRSGILDPLRVAQGPEVSLHVVGIEVSPMSGELPVAAISGAGRAPMFLTPAFWSAYHGILAPSEALLVRLRGGTAGADAFKTALESITGGAEYSTLTDQRTQVERPMHLEAIILAVIAGLATVALLIVVAQALSRSALLEGGETPALRALGMTADQLAGAQLLRAALVALLAAPVAVGVAVALSPLGPVGTAGTVEPDPGVTFDAVVLLPGALALVVVTLLLAAVPAWRAARVRDDEQSPWSLHPSRVAERLARAGLPPTVLAGVRLALDPGRGRRTVPVRAAVLGCVIAVATVTTGLTFDASMRNLVATPRLYGWNWDVALVDAMGQGRPPARLLQHPGIADISGVIVQNVGVNGDRTDAVAAQPIRGSLRPQATSGRPPRTADEIMLGARTLPELRLGDSVDVHVGSNSVVMRLVGRGVMPAVSEGSALGQGAWITSGALNLLSPGQRPSTYLVRYAPDAGTATQMTRWIEANFPQYVVLPAQEPGDIVGVRAVDRLPLLLACALALAAGGSLVHLLTTSIRRRRGHIAMLKTLGFVRAQILAAVTWQALTVAVAAVGLGLPFGVAAGRWAWNLFADRLGVVGDPVVPLLPVAAVVPAALALAVLAALVPGRMAASTRPADVLRAG